MIETIIVSETRSRICAIYVRAPLFLRHPERRGLSGLRKMQIVGLYRDETGLCEASIRLNVGDIDRGVIAAREATTSDADTKRFTAILRREHIQFIRQTV